MYIFYTCTYTLHKWVINQKQAMYKNLVDKNKVVDGSTELSIALSHQLTSVLLLTWVLSHQLTGVTIDLSYILSCVVNWFESLIDFVTICLSFWYYFECMVLLHQLNSYRKEKRQCLQTSVSRWMISFQM